jgi:hypothetical protein
MPIKGGALLLESLMEHQSWTAVVIYWIFSAAVSGMPEPASRDKAWYLWLYRFCHTIAGNLSTVLGRRIPGLKIPPFAVILPST